MVTAELTYSSEEKFRILVEAIRDYAICMLDPNGTITTWNSGAEILTGYSSQEIIGKNVSILSSSDGLKIARQKGRFEGESFWRRRDGSTFWAHIVIDPLHDSKGRLAGFSKIVRDITKVKETTERAKSLNEELERRVLERTIALQKSEAQLRHITNAIPILVAQVDRDGRMLFANNILCDWFGCDPESIRNMTFREVLGEERYKANKPYIDRALAGESVTYERNSVSGDRQGIYSITFVPEYDHENKVKGFTLVSTNVSKYKAIEAELKSAKEAAEVANETKSAFLANMSHEIRTPLGAVIGFSELIMDDGLSSAEKNRALEIIKRNGKLLSTIINDILDLSKVEAGKLEIEKVDVQLNDLLSEIVALWNLEAARKGIKLSVSSEGVIPTTIKTDPARLRQILFNIVGNAIKFTEKGTVALNMKLSQVDPSKLEFVVTDTGLGIVPDQAARLFSPFTQADATTTRRFGGTGLGLVLSQKLARALGGDVILESSVPGQGSTFVVRVDHGQSKQVFFENLIGHNGTSARTDLKGTKVLVVDDSVDNLVLVQKILKLMGAHVEAANNGREGVEKALHEKYDIILMDLQMPEMDGYEATKLLRREGFSRPIIALTAHAMKEERRRCLSSGFDDHLTKPIDRETLVFSLNRALA